jgi:hypothetical protein
MPKRVGSPPESAQPDQTNEKARAAFEAVVESIHDDNRMLEGRELWEAIKGVFTVTRAASSFKEPK